MTNKTKIPIVSKELLFPFIIITSLFALWGIAINIMNNRVEAKWSNIGSIYASLKQHYH